MGLPEHTVAVPTPRSIERLDLFNIPCFRNFFPDVVIVQRLVVDVIQPSSPDWPRFDGTGEAARPRDGS